MESIACSLYFLDRYQAEGDQLLEKIITGDEMWVFSHKLRIKTSINGMATNKRLPGKVKAKKTISTHKIMATVFWDRYGSFTRQFYATRDNNQCSHLLCHPY